MPAIVEVDESNGAVETVTDGITAYYYVSVDAPNSDPTGAMVKSTNSYEKWWRWHLVTLDDSTAVTQCRFYAAAAPPSGWAHGFNGSTLAGTYAGANHKQTTYSAPATTTTRTPETVPTADPGTANIGIGGSLTGSLTAPGRSDYLVSQLRCDGTVTSGPSLDLWFAYDEVA